MQKRNSVKVVIDTCALISLSVAGVLDKCSEHTNILIPERVRDELIDISQYDDLDGKHAKKHLETDSESNWSK